MTEGIVFVVFPTRSGKTTLEADIVPHFLAKSTLETVIFPTFWQNNDKNNMEADFSPALSGPKKTLETELCVFPRLLAKHRAVFSPRGPDPRLEAALCGGGGGLGGALRMAGCGSQAGWDKNTPFLKPHGGSRWLLFEKLVPPPPPFLG